MMMHAYLEQIQHPAYRLRIGPDGWVFGDPDYDFGLVIEDIGEHTARVSLLYKHGFGLAHWRAVEEALVGAGFERAVFERHRADGSVVVKEIKRGVDE